MGIFGWGERAPVSMDVNRAAEKLGGTPKVMRAIGVYKEELKTRQEQRSAGGGHSAPGDGELVLLAEKKLHEVLVEKGVTLQGFENSSSPVIQEFIDAMAGVGQLDESFENKNINSLDSLSTLCKTNETVAPLLEKVRTQELDVQSFGQSLSDAGYTIAENFSELVGQMIAESSPEPDVSNVVQFPGPAAGPENHDGETGIRKVG